MKLLVIDDNTNLRKTLKLILAPYFETIVTVGDPKLLPPILSSGDCDAVLLDMNFSKDSFDGAEGLFWLERIRGVPNPPAVIVITAFGELPLAVEAMKRGASDFVTKPWDNSELVSKLQTAIRNNRIANKDKARAMAAATMQSEKEQTLNMTLDEVKRAHIDSVIKECGGNLSEAANRLGINRQTLYNYLKK